MMSRYNRRSAPKGSPHPTKKTEEGLERLPTSNKQNRRRKMTLVVESDVASTTSDVVDADVVDVDDVNVTLENLLGEVNKVVVSQTVEKVETATRWLFLGCCKVETENRYEVHDLDTKKLLLVADEVSPWCMRNPCLFCDCICLCCHSDCSARRSFTLNLTTSSLNNPLVLEMDRPCRSDCLPCCLQKISVRDKSGLLGSVQQITNCVLPCTMCGLFQITDCNNEVIYTINTPCVLTTCCCTEGSFTILDMEGEEVGEIARQSAYMVKVTHSDADRFMINFPDECSVEMKAVLLGALFLFDFLFYEE